MDHDGPRDERAVAQYSSGPAIAEKLTLPVDRCLNPRVLECVYLPVSGFLAHDDQASRFLAGGGNAASLNVERFHYCYSNIWPDEPQFFDRVSPRMIVKRAPRRVQAGNHLGEV